MKKKELLEAFDSYSSAVHVRYDEELYIVDTKPCDEHTDRIVSDDQIAIKMIFSKRKSKDDQCGTVCLMLMLKLMKCGELWIITWYHDDVVITSNTGLVEALSEARDVLLKMQVAFEKKYPDKHRLDVYYKSDFTAFTLYDIPERKFKASYRPGLLNANLTKEETVWCRIALRQCKLDQLNTLKTCGVDVEIPSMEELSERLDKYGLDHDYNHVILVRDRFDKLVGVCYAVFDPIQHLVSVREMYYECKLTDAFDTDLLVQSMLECVERHRNRICPEGVEKAPIVVYTSADEIPTNLTSLGYHVIADVAYTR